MQITRNSIETATAPGEWFTGTVYLDTIATPSDRFMTHLAMQEVDEQGNPATWGEHVTDE